ncbi:histidine--tRNA ligase [Candidatus Roizmanbacteria bacterium RIFCSPHIGHO2_01_FULL_39_12b]|uniref:Histidine--tRNA ligase n=1 Tax=Candidatus Roizmanbacteria bacterium RIFCSPHIGHO2_01_FULL_39_12b TaxID=1802030 RepID=A0A1F7G9V7_9BACT|nr:MAG: histidine--tRNA ligase [Candidatus Roizmanbacteria bacterium RIFCSPHIGHO2_01_FULL_39_12b]OGK45905.1 MAG: histidine--tRNA ligase [Candidatus Roizmanbacteria bacterium RIFCSPLOWO2_01_FULL_39_19]
MSDIQLQPLKGFRQLYPEKKVIQSYVLNKAREVARLFGFEEYDGPLLEPIELYLNKSSRELVEEQSFKVNDKNNNTYLMRPEMTPTLARMVAAKYKELILPIRYFNAGLRYRYEAPQKGRDREFYQMDFDIIGSKSEISDIEILAIVATLFKSLGANKDNFVLYLNSRKILAKKLAEIGISSDQNKLVMSQVDRKEKISADEFEKLLIETNITNDQVKGVNRLLNDTKGYREEFKSILDLAKQYEIDDLIEVNPTVVRGLDYYTGIVFEAKSKGKLNRSLMGGGRYDNLVASYGATEAIGGVGFALSDSVALAFMEEFGLLPQLNPVPSQALVTMLDASATNIALKTAFRLRSSGINSEVYPDSSAKLDKQLRYADKKQIPIVVIIGPDEVKNNTITVKYMNERKQETLSVEELIQKLKK